MCRAESLRTVLLKYSPHSPGNYSLSGLGPSAYFFFSVSWHCVSRCLIFLLVPYPSHQSPAILIHLPVTRSTTSPSSSFFVQRVSITSLRCCLRPHLHYHSLHPHLGGPLFVTCKIGVEDTGDSITTLMNRLQMSLTPPHLINRRLITCLFCGTGTRPRPRLA